MIQFNPQVQDRRGDYMIQAAQANAEAMKGLGDNIGSALASLGQMYGTYKDKKDMLKGMDTAVMGMSDLGAITPDFRDKYLAADASTRPFLFQALASPMFSSYNAGQSAAAQAQAWDKYKSKWGSNAGGGPMPFTY